jgi:hypothetical protein
MEANVFAGLANLTRAQLVAILAREYGVDTLDGATWYAKAWYWATDIGVTDGTNPTATITREQIITILYRYAKLTGKDTTESASLDAFEDAGEVSEWAREATAWGVAKGLLSGRTLTTLAPGGTATRAETAALLQRFIEKL